MRLVLLFATWALLFSRMNAECAAHMESVRIYRGLMSMPATGAAYVAQPRKHTLSRHTSDLAPSSAPA